MRLIISGLVGLLLLCCNNSTTGDSETNTHQKTDDTKIENPLNGVWTDGSGPNASFSIEDDSIRDFEHNSKTKFVMHGDSVTFLDPDPNAVYRAKMYLIHDDTLVYEYSGVQTKYWRFRD